MKLVHNWKAAPRWFSMQLIAIAAIWEGIPEDAKQAIPEPWRGYVTLALLVAAGLGRMIDQGTARNG